MASGLSFSFCVAPLLMSKRLDSIDLELRLFWKELTSFTLGTYIPSRETSNHSRKVFRVWTQSSWGNPSPEPFPGCELWVMILPKMGLPSISTLRTVLEGEICWLMYYLLGAAESLLQNWQNWIFEQIGHSPILVFSVCSTVYTTTVCTSVY